MNVVADREVRTDQKGELKDLFIIGAGGFGREVAWLVRRINAVTPTWNIKGFIDDNESLWYTVEDGYNVLGGCDYLKKQESAWAVCAVGNAKTRKKIIEKLGASVNFATVIDPSVVISESVNIGVGTIICAGTIITVDEKIGNHVIINLDCTIGHDDVIDDYVTIYPSVNVSGACHLGTCVEIGTGSQIIQGLSVGDGTIVGASACVVKDLEAEVTAVGCPARVIKRH
jgi:sugar O-acyltransferase (sialic acid O-acetyltransferase NeuD family)